MHRTRPPPGPSESGWALFRRNPVQALWPQCGGRRQPARHGARAWWCTWWWCRVACGRGRAAAARRRTPLESRASTRSSSRRSGPSRSFLASGNADVPYTHTTSHQLGLGLGLFAHSPRTPPDTGTPHIHHDTCHPRLRLSSWVWHPQAPPLAISHTPHSTVGSTRTPPTPPLVASAHTPAREGGAPSRSTSIRIASTRIHVSIHTKHAHKHPPQHVAAASNCHQLASWRGP